MYCFARVSGMEPTFKELLLKRGIPEETIKKWEDEKVSRLKVGRAGFILTSIHEIFWLYATIIYNL